MTIKELRMAAKLVLFRASRDLTQGENMAEYNEAFSAFYEMACPKNVLGLINELVALRKIADLCKEEIEHGFDLPSELFDRTEAYWKKYRAPKVCPCEENVPNAELPRETK